MTNETLEITILIFAFTLTCFALAFTFDRVSNYILKRYNEINN